MPETRTTYRHILIVHAHRIAIPAATVYNYIYSGSNQPGLEYTYYAGHEIAHGQNPLDTIMAEVDSCLSASTRVEAIYIVGEFDDDEFVQLCEQVERRAELPVMPITIDELLGA